MTSRLVPLIRLGLLAILALALTPVVRSLWPEPMTPYAARFADASGLVPRNDVRINDVIVGRVTGVSLDGLEAVVSFEADTDVVLPDETAAEIRQTSLLGEYYLQLQPAGSDALPPRATIPASRTGRGTDLESVVALGGELTAQLNIDNLNRLIAGFDEATGGDPERLGRFLDSSAAAIGVLEDLSPSLTAAIDSVDALAASLAPSTDSLAGSIDRFAAGAEALQDSNDQIPNLVAGLDQLTGELEGLLQRNRERLVAASGRLRPVLDEVAANLDDLHSVVTGLAGFNRGWACAADGNYLNFVFPLTPELATVEVDPGRCDNVEDGPAGRSRAGQVQVAGIPNLFVDDPAGTGSLDFGVGTANEHRQPGSPLVLAPGQRAVTIDGVGPMIASVLLASAAGAAT